MIILPVRTPVLTAESDFAEVLCAAMQFQDGDIVVVSSKAVATCEGDGYDLTTLTTSPDAVALGEHAQRNPVFMEAVLQETKRLRGEVIGHCPGAALTVLRPDGMQGEIIAPNAGLDTSNVPLSRAIGWPVDPVASVKKLRHAIEEITSVRIALIIGDSCCSIRRKGVTAFALTVSGVDPLRNEIGTNDLYGRALRMTEEAVADQLTIAANAVMGNAAQSAPAAVIRDHGITFTDFEGWVPVISPKEDLFSALL